MRLLSWNSRGFGNPRIVQSLGLLIKDKGPGMVFLFETKLFGEKARRIARRFKYEGCIVVDVVGRSAGLLFMWKEEVSFDLFNYSQRHVSGFISNDRANGSK